MNASAIYIAPTPTSLGWTSMNRYRQALEKEMPCGADRPHILWPDRDVHATASGRLKCWFDRQIVYPKIIRSQVPADALLHVLDHSFAELLTHVQPNVRTVVTLHDLILMRFRHRVAHLRQADAVVCVSEFTRQEALRLLRLPDSKLHVIHNGASPLPAPDAEMQQRLSSLPAFVLSVGGTTIRKNLQILPTVFEHLTNNGVSSVLVRAGAWLDSDLARAIRRHALLVELGPVNDACLSAAYASAAVTIVPSLLEGFGLPVLEAMRAGCPVVHANTSSLPEVAADAGLRFDPQEPTKAAECIRRIMQDSDLRESLIRLGKQRADVLTWRAHWLALTRVYEQLLG
jgi:glycosyltransferase involved in cell wall biosynthesis